MEQVVFASLLLPNDYVDYEAIDGDTDIEADYPCPFCSEDFDIVGLYCHIEEEHFDEERGEYVLQYCQVCPMCGAGIGVDLVEHIAFQHENLYKNGNKTRDSHVVDQLLTSFVCIYSTSPEAEGKLSSSAR